MCEYCKGTHVVHAYDRAIGMAMTCPICGPEDDEVVNERMRALRQMVESYKTNEEVI